MTDLGALEERLSQPDAAVVADLAALPGDILILGVSGKMGPSLARLARRASDRSGTRRRVIGVARFGAPEVRDKLEADGVECLPADLLDRAAVAALPDAPNVVYMAGQKFGTGGDPCRTWATNVLAAALAAERYAASRIVAFSTGNVYPLTPAAARGASERDAVGPVGEYAQSALGRERVLEYWSRRHGTRVAILRLNYAIEPRYGVLRDLADQLVRGDAIDLTMGYVNVIWQRDANAVALRALAHAASPPFVLNLTGTATLPVRELATRLGAALGVAPRFAGREADTALLSDASRCAALFGEPPTTLETMVAEVAAWVKAGGPGLGKPTRFQERGGAF